MALCKNQCAYSADCRFMVRFRCNSFSGSNVKKSFTSEQVKMSLITQAYFEEGDFSNVSLIKVSTAHNLGDFQHGASS